jgi:hypothetical protein
VGPLTVTNSTVSSNQGGGISVTLTSVTVSITNSTIANNTARGGGGGIGLDILSFGGGVPTSSASFTVHVKGAAEQFADLLTAVTGFGPGTSLADKVSQAGTYLTANDVADACSTLNAFIKEVKAQLGITLLPSQAATLIATAQRIETVLGC